ncbi:hypothetical protein [Halomarina pelagica]|uniref:hypothetical protein n=1 Tax=Halomarina pelagica TaxID=2961599 RepID=UPI0020C30DE4|nr:hypothetical protein [Halomarina sp. BND7]
MAGFDSGSICLMVLQAAAMKGADPVYVSKPDPYRRGLAEEYGADEVIDLIATDLVEYVAEGGFVWLLDEESEAVKILAQS